MGKMKFILLGVIIVVAIIAAYFFIFSKAVPAKLLVTSQPVEVYKGSWSTASDGMALYQGDRIRTGAGGKAVIVWFDASVTRLDENTEVDIITLITEGNRSIELDQNNGRTWNRVLVASGVSSYSVETPTAVASVRGTGFAVTANDNESTIAVVEGSIQTTSLGSGGAELATALLGANQSSTVKLGDTTIVVDTLVMDDWINSNLQYDEQYIQTVKANLKQKYGILLTVAKTRGMTNELIDEYLDKYVRGQMTVREAVEKGWLSESDVALIPEELRYERPR